MLLYVGDDWAEDHHDVELQDDRGRRLARARLPEGLEGITRLHALIGAHLGDSDPATAQIVVGIETERGLWPQALIAAGYEVFPINPLQAARYRTRCGVSGAKSDTGDAHLLADMVRTDQAHLLQAAGDTPIAKALRVLTRAHKTLIWERTRHVARLRQTLLDFFPAAVEAYQDLDEPDVLELLMLAPDPDTAAALADEQIAGALRLARRRKITDRVARIQQILRRPQLRHPAVVTTAHAAVVTSQAGILITLNLAIEDMQEQVEACFRQHPQSAVYLSQPGLGLILGARVLGEFGDDATRYANAKARRNYAGTSPITRQSGRKKTVLARYVHNDRLLDALGAQAFSALSTSPGVRAYYDRQRARGVGHRAALRQVGNRLVGILHGCLKTGTVYDESTAWAATADTHDSEHRTQPVAA